MMYREGETPERSRPVEKQVDARSLEAGQVLARDAHAPDGGLLAPRATVLTPSLLERFAEQGVASAWIEVSADRDTATRPVPGSFRFLRKKDAVSITVQPPRAGGEAVDLEVVKAEARKQDLERIDWPRCEAAVKQARGIPVDITARDGSFRLELEDEGLFLTVSRPLTGGKRVGLFHLQKELESKGWRWFDEHHVQRAVAAATGRREKIGDKQGAVRVQVSPDRMSAEIVVWGPNGGEPADEDAANRALHHAKVTHGLLPAEVKSAVRPERWGTSTTVARGEAAVEGTPAQILERFRESPTPRALGQRLGCVLLEPTAIVEPGEVLLEKVPPAPGRDGLDVCGCVRRHRPAVDRELPRAGANAERSSDGLLLTAKARGVPAPSGASFSVEPLRSLRLEAPDLDRAVAAGAALLEVPGEAIGVEVEQTGHKGILGIGATPFRARLFRKEAPPPEAPAAKKSPEPVRVVESSDERPPKTVEVAADRNGHRELALHTDADRFHLFLTLRQKSDPAAVQPREVWALMEQAGIVLPDEERARVDDFLALLAQGPADVRWKRLASGRAPTPGPDAPVNWRVRCEDDRPDEAEPADHHQVSRFANVDRGDVLCTLGDPGPGADGADLFGRTLPAPPGAAAPIRAGEHVRLSEDGRSLLADENGTMRVKDGVLSVHSVHRVRGDVNFQVGNIDFNGVVEVDGNILDDFRVRTSADLLVGGNIEGADIDVGRDLRVRHGITGHEKGRIRVRGNVEAKYLNGANLIVDGDVVVRVQILNSTVVSRGRIMVEQGGIVGGITAALVGVRCQVMGSEMGIRTEVVAGVDRVGSVLLEEIETRLADLDGKIARVESAVRPFLDHPDLLDALPGEKRDAGRKLLDRLEKMKEERDALAADRDRPAPPPSEPVRAFITLSKRAYQNVDLRVGPSCRMRIESEVNGPVKFRANEETGGLDAFRA